MCDECATTADSPNEQLVLRVKRPAAVRPIAVEGQVDFQAVGQKLHGTRELLGVVAEGMSF